MNRGGSPAVFAPSSGGLTEADDGVLGGILGQVPAPRGNVTIDLVPPWSEGTLAEPSAHIESGLELAQGPLVGEAGVARVLLESDSWVGVALRQMRCDLSKVQA